VSHSGRPGCSQSTPLTTLATHLAILPLGGLLQQLHSLGITMKRSQDLNFTSNCADSETLRTYTLDQGFGQLGAVQEASQLRDGMNWVGSKTPGWVR
jgi:hypothetical protein